MSILQECIEQVFDERKNFIVIGLTGRTGSGCTETAKLLTSDFNDLNLRKPTQSNFKNNDERNYAILYDYGSINWKPFTIIQVSNVISTFLLEKGFNDFIAYINSIDSTAISFDKNRCISELSGLESEYINLSKLRLKHQKEILANETIIADDEIYNFFFNLVDPFTKKIKNILENHTRGLYTYIWQQMGDNIRSSGEVFNTTLNPTNLFKLPQRINLYIKILRRRNKNTKEGVRVVIDAIRNPFEAIFFKDRYAAFYLFAVTSDESDRFARLINLNFSKKEIEAIDEKEYPKKKIKKEYFSSQDIQRCIELSDVYLHNKTESPTDMFELSKQLFRYISLIMHPGLVTPTNIERCMQTAFNAKANSGCISRQVGAAVTDENFSIMSIGWNDVPEGQVSCGLRDINKLLDNNDSEAFSDFEKSNEFKCFVKKKLSTMEQKVKGRYCRFCFKDAYNSYIEQKNQVHTRALHAEENAFLQIIKRGGGLVKNGNLFTTASPCELCSKKAYQLGLANIFFIDPYPGISESHIINSGKQRPKLKYFQGAVGRAYNQLYQNFMPLKDENEILYTMKF